MTFHSENIDSVGFRRAALLAFLSLDGIHLPELDANPAPLTTPAPPWAEARRGLKRLSLSEAANVLIGIDPLDGEWRGDDEWREFDGAKRVLQQALEDGEIHSVGLDFKNDSVEIFSTSDLRAWALSHGYEWPIPEIQSSAGPAPALSGSAPVASGEILKRLQDSERERNELRAEVEKLRAEAKHATDQTTALAEQAEQIGMLQAENRKAKTEIERLQTEIAKGKSLPTLQKLVIAMAIDGYGYKPEDSKSPIPKQIEGITGGFEIEVTDETVLRHLKLAATTHLPRSAG